MNHEKARRATRPEYGVQVWPFCAKNSPPKKKKPPDSCHRVDLVRLGKKPEYFYPIWFTRFVSAPRTSNVNLYPLDYISTNDVCSRACRLICTICKTAFTKLRSFRKNCEPHLHGLD